MNGNDKAIIPGVVVPPINREFVAMLETALAQVQAGKVAGLAVVVVHGPDSLSLNAGGAHAATIAAGCNKLASQMTEALFQKRSPILQMRR